MNLLYLLIYWWLFVDRSCICIKKLLEYWNQLFLLHGLRLIFDNIDLRWNDYFFSPHLFDVLIKQEKLVGHHQLEAWCPWEHVVVKFKVLLLLLSELKQGIEMKLRDVFRVESLLMVTVLAIAVHFHWLLFEV